MAEFEEDRDMRNLLICDGIIVTAERSIPADLFIENEKITEIGPSLERKDAYVIDAQGKLIFPGGIDPHVHLDLPMFDTISSDDYYTGGKAAAFGGTTTLLDFVPQTQQTLKASVDVWKEKSKSRACIDYGLHMNITRLDEKILDEIPALIDQGITTLKVFMAYNGRLRLQDGEILRVMRQAAAHGMLTMLHAENGDSIELLTQEALANKNTSPEWHALTRPAWGAAEAVLRGIALAEEAAAALYIVHLNTAGGVEQLQSGRGRGVRVMGETCPAYLYFTMEHLRREDGAKWVCSPPMRSRADNQVLWQALSDGKIQSLGTDHCPFFYDGNKAILYEGKPIAIPGKELGEKDFTKIPNGLPGVGDRLPILWTFGVGQGKISAQQFVALTSTNPAKIFGLYPKKGALKVGSDADIVIWDPERTITYGVEYAQHRTDYNLFEGWELVGYPETVLLRGKIVVHKEKWMGKAGMGQFVPRIPNAEII
ncbi:MAG: dihydropyrimidinase [Chloroflexi bacterium]|nr:dihydropyrimidinase [Chloroflexota bacterium]